MEGKNNGRICQYEITIKEVKKENLSFVFSYQVSATSIYFKNSLKCRKLFKNHHFIKEENKLWT